MLFLDKDSKKNITLEANIVRRIC